MNKKIILTIIISMTISCTNFIYIKKNSEKEYKASVLQENKTENLIISFFSYGSGIDRKKKDAFVNYIAINYPDIQYESVKWGKEGEIDFCIKKHSLNQQEIIEIEKYIEQLISSSNRIKLLKNTACRIR